MKLSLEIDIDELVNNLKKVGGDVEKTTEKALKKSHEYITPLIEDKVQDSNLPAHGKYSKEGKHVRKQIIKDQNIDWQGSSCTIDVGFSLKETAVPIFMIRGTEKMSPVKGLKSTLEGTKTKEKIAEIQEDVFVEEIQKKLGGQNG